MTLKFLKQNFSRVSSLAVGLLAGVGSVSLAAAEPVLNSTKDGFGYVVESISDYAAADAYCKWNGYVFASTFQDINQCPSSDKCSSTKGWKFSNGAFVFSEGVSRYFVRIDCALDAPLPAEVPVRGQKSFSQPSIEVSDGRSLAVGPGSDGGGSALRYCIQKGYRSLVSYRFEDTCNTGVCAYKPGFVWAEGRWRYQDRLKQVLANVMCSNP